MSEWITLNEDSIQDYMNPLQLSAMRTQGDRLKYIIADITARIRTEVGGNPDNVVNESKHTIPEELKSVACYLVIEALQSRIPTLKLSPDQVRNADNARKFLRRVAKGEVTITNSLVSRTIPVITLVSKRPEVVTSSTLKGL